MLGGKATVTCQRYEAPASAVRPTASRHLGLRPAEDTGLADSWFRSLRTRVLGCSLPTPLSAANASPGGRRSFLKLADRAAASTRRRINASKQPGPTAVTLSTDEGLTDTCSLLRLSGICDEA